MREFEVFRIKDQDRHFKVEVEYTDNREREFFAFPKTGDWFREVNGVPRYMLMIQSKLASRAAKQEPDTEYRAKLDDNINRMQGKKFRMTAMGTMTEVPQTAPSSESQDI